MQKKMLKIYHIKSFLYKLKEEQNSFMKAIVKVIRLCTVLTFLRGSFEDMGIFHVFQLSFDGGWGVISTITDR